MQNEKRDYYQELRELRAWASAVRDRVDQLSASGGPSGPAASAELRRAAKLADELHERAGEPISIGLVGEYSVGKSRLLNALVGLPGLLPVSGSPTTGNITALRVRAARPGEPTGGQRAWVSYMSREELSRVAAFMLGELKSVINGNRLPYDVSPLRGYNPVASDWDTFENLARTWWQPGQPANHEVRLYAWELLQLRNAIVAGWELIPAKGSGRPIEVDLDRVREAIEIGDSRELPERFPERPPRRRVPADAPLTAAVLKDTFLLIRRLSYDVVIEPGLLDLGGLRDSNGLELLDFAGLHTAGAARDEYLCGRELERITGYLEVVKADHAETRTATRFATMLEGRRRSKAHLADSVMLVANKFDLVEIPPPSSTIRGLTALSDDLRSLLKIARGVNPELRRLALTTSLGEPADSRWLTVADALDGPQGTGKGADSEEARLADALRGYVHDGGVSRLQAMLSEHIGTVALPVMVDELAALRDELAGVLTRLRDLLAPRPAPSGAPDARKRLGDLVVGLHRMIIDVRDAARVFRDADGIKVAAAGEQAAGEADGLLELIRQEAVTRVYAWPEWDRVFGHYKEGQIRAPEEASETGAVPGGLQDPDDPAVQSDPSDWLDWADGDDGSGATDGWEASYGAEDTESDDEYNILTQKVAKPGSGHSGTTGDRAPKTTKDLEAPFEASLSELREAARGLSRDVLTAWVERLHQRHEALRAMLADQATRTLLADRLTVLFKDRGADRLRLLEMIAELGWVPGLFDRFLTGTQDRAAREGASAFPLALDHALPWNPVYETSDAGEEELSALRHHSRAHRMRHDLAEGLAFPVQTAVAMAFGSLEAELAGRLGELQGQVPNQATLLAAAPAAAPTPADTAAAGLLDDLIDGPASGAEENQGDQ
jgi:hypothetical protein